MQLGPACQNCQLLSGQVAGRSFPSTADYFKIHRISTGNLQQIHRRPPSPLSDKQNISPRKISDSCGVPPHQLHTSHRVHRTLPRPFRLHKNVLCRAVLQTNSFAFLRTLHVVLSDHGKYHVGDGGDHSVIEQNILQGLVERINDIVVFG